MKSILLGLGWSTVILGCVAVFRTAEQTPINGSIIFDIKAGVFGCMASLGLLVVASAIRMDENNGKAKV